MRNACLHGCLHTPSCTSLATLLAASCAKSHRKKKSCHTPLGLQPLYWVLTVPCVLDGVLLTEIAVLGAVWSMLLLLLTQFNASILHEPHVWCRLAVQLLPACGAGKRFAQAPDWRPAYTQTREYACVNNGRSSICSCAPFSEASVAQICLKSEVTPAVHLGLSDPTSLQPFFPHQATST